MMCNPPGFITKCYSFERGRHRDCKQKCVFLSVSVCVWFTLFLCARLCVVVCMTNTHSVRVKVSVADR